MALLLHHHHTPTRIGTVLKALLTLMFVTAVVATGAGLAALAVSKLLLALLSGVAGQNS